MKARGFIFPGMTTIYGAIGAIIVIAGLGEALKVQTHRLALSEAAYDSFVAQTKALGDVQNEKVKAADQLHASIVKEKDHENSALHDKLSTTSKRVRDTNTRGSLVPQNPAGSASPNLACFDRAELDSALREFSRATSELAIEGESATIDLDTGKKWIQEISSADRVRRVFSKNTP